jgi:hypothetical protein
VSEEHGTGASTAGFSAERIGRNDAIFRKANEAIADLAEDTESEETVPFICECADPGCHEIIRMSLDEYSEIRSDPRNFLNVPGHEASAQGWGQVVETHDGYVVVAKIGPAGEVAEQLEGDPDPATAEVDADDRHSKDETL